MNSKGQAALEYLMTYGWALVIIVIVAGILFLLVSSPSAGVKCQSSDPTKFPVIRYNVATTGTNEVVISNGAGGSITTTANTAAGGLAVGTEVFTPDTDTVVGGGTVTLNAFTAPTAGDAFSGTAAITYTDPNGYTGKSVTITCQGTAQ